MCVCFAGVSICICATWIRTSDLHYESSRFGFPWFFLFFLVVYFDINCLWFMYICTYLCVCVCVRHMPLTVHELYIWGNIYLRDVSAIEWNDVRASRRLFCVWFNIARMHSQIVVVIYLFFSSWDFDFSLILVYMFLAPWFFLGGEV